jgi:hypothetical protein
MPRRQVGDVSVRELDRDARRARAHMAVLAELEGEVLDAARRLAESSLALL